ncbi:MAG: helix-turn-helix transcriptional regulator [Clostridia bacterium]|nr:helix-turn-helix transcriptional regulator [Clostridia bacterium]
MNIGEKIKELRIKSGLTQNKLAELLCISYQAVSKWETGTANPDLGMIAPLTKIFNISADELLGINEKEPDARYDELKKEYELTFYTENYAKRQEICETAVREYPNDMKWLEDLAWVVSNRSFEHTDQEEFVAEQEKAIKLFDNVIKASTDEYIRGDAIIGITQLLGWRGRKNEAKQYAEMLPERVPVKREAVMENVLEGNELLKYKQEQLNSHFHSLIWILSLMPDNEYTELIKKLIDTMIPDGNYLEYNHSLYYASRRSVNRLLRENGDKEEILGFLVEMKRYAQEYDSIVFDKPDVSLYTVSHLRLIEEDTREWLGNQGERLTGEFTKYLQNHSFDFLRGENEFAELIK